MNFLFFLKQFLKDFKQTGAVLPSSKALTKKMLKNINFDRPVKIVELGPGTGCMTREILKRMHPKSELICVEINPDFCERLKQIKTDKKFSVLQTSAADLASQIDTHSIHYVVSGLPLANFRTNEVESIFGSIQNILKAQGSYIQFQYTLRLDETIKQYFSIVIKSFSLFNFPPAFIYSCSY